MRDVKRITFIANLLIAALLAFGCLAIPSGYAKWERMEDARRGQ